jgi:hypothetical protein
MTYTPTEYDNPFLGLFFGESQGKIMTADNTLKLMLSSGEFNLSNMAHTQFVTRICRYGKANNIAIMGGTEASQISSNNTRDLLRKLGPQFGFSVASNIHGEWLMVAKRFGAIVDSRYIPVIPANAGGSKHDVRGIQTVHIKPLDATIGEVFAGVSHYLAGHVPGRGPLNLALKQAVASWGEQVAQGTNIAFHMGDVNTDDKPADAYLPGSFKSCWDELHRWPVTHPHGGGKGPTIDVIASLNKDQRVKCASARALTDTILPLPVDHFSVEADYKVTPLKGNKS